MEEKDLAGTKCFHNQLNARKMLLMDTIDRKICEILQRDGRITNSEIATALDLSVSAASERVRRLVSAGSVTGFRAILDTKVVGADFCCFLFIDMQYQGEQDAVAALTERPEVLELHHISGAHSYLAKVRVADAHALEVFLQDAVKPLQAVHRTETILSMSVRKETTAVKIASGDQD